ncbi:unnamed protein product [Prorocentrum cordatum]|uniref:Uncharacterized protein n=1 Tax=Prorocentrum cordatum TaxID=2364126 RepID=A0ABN9SFA5_9DINO|nr:unnamed protein product [Polarella glacialis]
MIAERYLAEHLEGRSLGILPSRREFAGRDGGRDTNGMELLVRTLELPAELPAEPQVLAAANTNVGLMAGLMANIGERREVSQGFLPGPSFTLAVASVHLSPSGDGLGVLLHRPVVSLMARCIHTSMLIFHWHVGIIAYLAHYWPISLASP